jgi:hypothetical protein
MGTGKLTASSTATWRNGNTIELNLQDLEQFFNTMDPSPFHEKDLDTDAEEFIVSWAKEYPPDAPVRLIVHLQNAQLGGDAHAIITRAVHNYFAYKADLSQRELRQLFRAGRISLIIGLSFLALCVSGAEVLAGLRVPGTKVLQTGLTIGGWVAMWHPMEVYLYGWWPLRRMGKIYRKLSTIPVEVRCAKTPARVVEDNVQLVQ